MDQKLPQNPDTIYKLINLIEEIGEDTFRKYIVTYLRHGVNRDDLYDSFHKHIKSMQKHKSIYTNKLSNTHYFK